MIQNIPNKFNKMVVYKRPSDPTPPPIMTGLIWHMDFSNGLYLPYSLITGTNEDSNCFEILTDQLMGTYLHCTQDQGNSIKVYWDGSMDYFNNIFVTGRLPFSVSFWLKAPDWNDYNNLVVLSWKTDDSGRGAVFYRDGSSSSINSRTENCWWIQTITDANYNSQWNHWVYVRDSEGATWYCNGVVDGTFNEVSGQKAPQDANIRANSNLMIGKGLYWGCNAVFDVTKYRIYHGALTSSEVADLYTNKE